MTMTISRYPNIVASRKQKMLTRLNDNEVKRVAFSQISGHVKCNLRTWRLAVREMLLLKL